MKKALGEKRRKLCLWDLMELTVVAMHLKNASVQCPWSQAVESWVLGETLDSAGKSPVLQV